MARRYIVGTGYFDGGNPDRAYAMTGMSARHFFRIWAKNTIRYTNPKKVFVISVSSSRQKYGDFEWITFGNNLGHVLDPVLKPYLCGCQMSFLMLCLAAYHENCDLLFKEQDCLAFGNYVSLFQRELKAKNAKMLLGKTNGLGEAQGLVPLTLIYVKHEFLLRIVKLYLSIEHSDHRLLPEVKFRSLMKLYRSIRSMSIGYDRTRPINFDDKVFYGQHWVPEELRELRRRKLI